MQHQLAGDYRDILEKCQEVSTFIEKGQAQTPLCDLFQQLATDVEQKPLAITLLCLTPSSRSAALKWLYGHNFAFFSVEVSKQIGLLELQLKERGFSLEKSTGERMDFQHWDELVDAIVDAKILDASSKTALKLGTEAATGIKNLHVLLPESAEFIEESPALLTRLVRESNLLVVSAPMGYQLTDVDRRVMQSLLDDMAGLWPLPVMNDTDSMTMNQWWLEFRPRVSIPLMILTEPTVGSLPDYLTDNTHPFRIALQYSLYAQKQQSAANALVEHYQQELQKLLARQKREERTAGNETSRLTTPTAPTGQQLRSQLDDAMTDIRQFLESSNRKSELAGATGMVTLGQHIDSLKPEDLQQTAGHKVIKLTLDERYLRSVTQAITSLTQLSLKEDVQAVQQKNETFAKLLSQQLSKEIGLPVQFNAPTIDEKQLMKDLLELVRVDMRYQGEMPKRGIVDRLSEGRKSVFMVLMVVSLLGTMLGSSELRNSKWLGFVLLPMFIGSVIYTYYSWQQEDQHRFEKELGKVKDELQSSTKRLITELNRLKLQHITLHLDRLKKQWQQQVEQLLREHQQRNTQQAELEKSKARARLQGIAKQVRDWEGYRFQVQKLTSESEQFGKKVAELMRTAAQRQ